MAEIFFFLTEKKKKKKKQEINKIPSMDIRGRMPHATVQQMLTLQFTHKHSRTSFQLRC